MYGKTYSLSQLDTALSVRYLSEAAIPSVLRLIFNIERDSVNEVISVDRSLEDGACYVQPAPRTVLTNEWPSDHIMQGGPGNFFFSTVVATRDIDRRRPGTCS